MARRRPAAIHGVLAIDKPAGMTSRAVVNAVARGLGERRVGHCGTLDPMATGVLVIGVGEATSAMQWLMVAPKAYQAELQFGAETDTDDADGTPTQLAPTPVLTAESLAAALPVGPITLQQVPPAVSALQRDGVRDYERARRGELIVRPPRPVFLRSAEVLAVDAAAGTATVRVEVGAGFYVRALARDLGRSLGSAAHLKALRRVQGSGSDVDACWPLATWQALSDEAKQATLQPLATALAPVLAICEVEPQVARALRRGQRPEVAAWPVLLDGPTPALAVLADGEAVAVVEAEVLPTGGVRLRTLRGFGVGAQAAPADKDRERTDDTEAAPDDGALEDGGSALAEVGAAPTGTGDPCVAMCDAPAVDDAFAGAAHVPAVSP